MFVVIFLQILFSTYANTWSHLRGVRDGSSKEFLVTKIVNGRKNLSYCIETDATYKLNALKYIVELGFDTFMDAVIFYDFDVYNAWGGKIDLRDIKISYAGPCSSVDSKVDLFITTIRTDPRIYTSYYDETIFMVEGESEYIGINVRKNKNNFDKIKNIIYSIQEHSKKDIYYAVKNLNKLFIDNNLIFPKVEKKDLFINVFLHELGHAFGLGEAGVFCDYNDPNYSHLDLLKAPSIMDGTFDFLYPTCDDVEGIILLFDRSSAYKRKNFKSLCAFREGKYLNSKPYGLWKYLNITEFYKGNIELEYEINYSGNGEAYLKEYFEDRLISEGNYLNGLKQGVFKSYFFNELSNETNYEKGLKDGFEIIYGLSGFVWYRSWVNGQASH